MSDNLLKMLTEAFGNDTDIEVYAMGDDGEITPLNKGAQEKVQRKVVVAAHVYNLVDPQGEEYGLGDEVFDPEGASYTITKGEPPAGPDEPGLGWVWVDDKWGHEHCMCPSIFELKFEYKRTIKP